ncbi:UNVERIFIED_CONTAM: hypothetical protein K2H54_047947 [Gekko kuhli]
MHNKCSYTGTLIGLIPFVRPIASRWKITQAGDAPVQRSSVSETRTLLLPLLLQLKAYSTQQHSSLSPILTECAKGLQSSYELDRSLSALEVQSEANLDPRSVPSPDDTIADRSTISPSEDMSSFTNQIVRMAKALELKHASSEPRMKDPLMQALFTPNKGPVALPCLQGLQEVMFAAWEHLASTTPSGRRLEGLYKIIDLDCGFLFQHPPLNSFISEVISAHM